MLSGSRDGVLTESLMDLRRCPACLQDVNQLKILPCQHFTCMECAGSLDVTNGRYKCAQCQPSEEHLVPNGGFSYLPNSWIANQLSELANQKGADNVMMGDVDIEQLKEMLGEELTLASRWMDCAKKMVGDVSVDIANTSVDPFIIMVKIQEYRKSVTQLADTKLLKLTQRLEEETAELEDKVHQVESLKDLRGSVSRVVQRLKDETCSAGAFSEANNLVDSLKQARTNLQELQKYLDDASEPEAGDSVRLKYELTEDIDMFMGESLTHSTIGILLEKTSEDGLAAVVFPEKHNWRGRLSSLEKSLKKAELPYVGDEVRVLVEKPCFGWQHLRRRCPGTLAKIDLTEPAPRNDVIIYVDFAEAKQWKGLYSELFEPEPTETQMPVLERTINAVCVGLLRMFGTVGASALPAIANKTENSASARSEVSKRRTAIKALRPSTGHCNSSSDLCKLSEEAKRNMRSELQGVNDSCAALSKESHQMISKINQKKDGLPSKAKSGASQIKDFVKTVELRCTEKVQKEALEVQDLLRELSAYNTLITDLQMIVASAYEAACQSRDALSSRSLTPLQLRNAEICLHHLRSKNMQARRIRFGVDSFYEWKEGVCTRLRAADFTQDFMAKYVKGKTTIGSAGLQLQLAQDPRSGQKFVKVLFEADKEPWWIHQSFAPWILTQRRIPFKGDKVKLKQSESTLGDEQGQTSSRNIRSHGILLELFPQAKVKFPDKEELWIGSYNDLELVCGCEFEVGDSVWVRRTIPEPSRGWGGVNGSSVGVVKRINKIGDLEEITVDFPECEGWIGQATDLERERPVNMEDEVQVKLSVREPKYGWQSVSHDDIGILIKLDEKECVVGFRSNPKFRCLTSEIEPYRYHRAHYEMSRSEVTELGQFVPKEELRRLMEANL